MFVFGPEWVIGRGANGFVEAFDVEIDYLGRLMLEGAGNNPARAVENTKENTKGIERIQREYKGDKSNNQESVESWTAVNMCPRPTITPRF